MRLIINSVAVVAVAYALALAWFIFSRPAAVAWWAVLVGLALIALPVALMWWEHRHWTQDSN